jgi:hypothetical protein
VAADEALDDVWVEGGSAVGNALDGADELRHVAHTVFQEIADARGIFADQLEHVRGLEVLGEDEHGDGGVGAPDHVDVKMPPGQADDGLLAAAEIRPSSKRCARCNQPFATTGSPRKAL